jgi:hypothetical protein
MNRKLLLAVFLSSFALLAMAGPLTRIGHTTLVPRNTSPDDKGMYGACIDPTNGYAYFIGAYLYKLDITGGLPVPIGPPLLTGQFTQTAIDPAAGFLYLPRSGSSATLFRYAVGTGTNIVTANSTLALPACTSAEVVIDDSDPVPANHYAYVLCSSIPASVVKVSLGATMSIVSSTNLAAGETNFIFAGAADVAKGYAYFASFPGNNTNTPPLVVKIKFTPGANPPGRVGAVNLDTVGTSIDGGCIDTLHGYAYYDTYDSNTNNPGIIYKVKLGDGDAPPALVGKVSLHPGEGRMSASVCDPANGFVYFANDNSYPGSIYQLSLNGTNVPVEVATLHLQAGPMQPPPDGITTNNTTTNVDGILPFGEVFIRSGVFDPVRGFAYFGQDSRPNQVVKVQLAKADPFTLTSARFTNNGAFTFGFTNIAGAPFTASASTNLLLTNWTTLGSVTDNPPGQYQFTDPAATNRAQFYRVSAP